MSDKLALYKADWMRVLADVGLGAVAISRAIELAELNGLFDPVESAAQYHEENNELFQRAVKAETALRGSRS